MDPLVAEAMTILACRKKRLSSLNRKYFGEPAWQVLLSLFVAESAARPITVSQLCKDSGAPMTTALRVLEMLRGDHLVERQRSMRDARVVHIVLTAMAREALKNCLREHLVTRQSFPPSTF